MSLLKSFFFHAANAMPMPLLNKVASLNVLLPYHHVVSDDDLPHISGLYKYKNIKQFTDDLEWILRYRRPVHPDQLVMSIKKNEPLPANSFLFTFDDGFREVFDIVAPILYNKGIPAIFFINPSFVDNKKLFYRCKLSLVLKKLYEENNQEKIKQIANALSTNVSSLENLKKEIMKIHYPDQEKADELGNIMEISFEDYLKSQRPFMTKEQIKSLAEKGFTIGAHSMDHPHYALISEQDQINQTLQSCKYVKALTNQDNNLFSFPHEDKAVKQSFFDLLRKDNSIDLFFGVQNQLDEKRNPILHRFNAEDPSKPLKLTTQGILLYNYLLNKMNWNSVTRR